MLASNLPTKIATPWANSAGGSYIRTVPVPSQIGITNGAASFTDGFPPLCFIQQAAGGYPPDGRDLNYVLNLFSQWARWQQAGGATPFDATFSSSVGGYPNGAVIPSADTTGYWRSTADNNTTNPDTSTTTATPTWLPHFFYGTSTISLSSANVTLSNLQYCKPVIVLTGTLTANVTLTFPQIVGDWVIENNTTGSFTVTAQTSGGSGVTAPNGSIALYSDGTNMYASSGGFLTTTVAAATYAPMSSGTLIAFQQSTAPTGWTKGTTYNDAILRIVNGAAGSGGSQSFSGWNASASTGLTALSIVQIPAHNHTATDSGHTHSFTNGVLGTAGAPSSIAVPGGSTPLYNPAQTAVSYANVTIGNTGSGQPHNHTITTNILYVDFIIASKN